MGRSGDYVYNNACDLVSVESIIDSVKDFNGIFLVNMKKKSVTFF